MEERERERERDREKQIMTLLKCLIWDRKHEKYIDNVLI